MDRRQFATALAGGAATIALASCATSGGTVSAFLSTVSGILSSAANGLAGALSQLQAATGITIPAPTVATLQGSINALSQIATTVATAAQSAASTALQKAENYLTAAISAAQTILTIPGVSALPFSGTLTTALAAASTILPFLEGGINYLVGVLSSPPSTTAATTPAASAKFGALLQSMGVGLGNKPSNVAQAKTFLDSVAVVP